MIRIRFFSNFCEGDCYKIFIRLSELETSDPDYNVKYSFTEGDDYTHAILLNTPMPTLSIPKENVVGIAFEPPMFLRITNTFVNYAINHIGTYLIGGVYNLPKPFKEHHGYMWHTPYKSKIEPKTGNPMSIMVSHKKNAPGHKYRHELVSKILSSTLPIDIYGNGCKYYNTNDSRIKGEFKNNEIYDTYKYHVCIENFQTPHYFSEKITNPLICGSIPIYLGCSAQYFDDMIIRLSGNIDDDFNLLKNICETLPEPRIQDINKVKDIINVKHLIHDYFIV
jgi:hypothetical protein